MNDQYNRFEPNYLEQEPAIILEQDQPTGQRSDSYIHSYEYEEQQAQQRAQAQDVQEPSQQQVEPQQQEQQQQQQEDDEETLQQHQHQQHQHQAQLQQQPVPEEEDAGPGGEGDDLMGDSVFSNVGQGLTGNYRNMMMAYWQETINSIEHEEHDFKNHQLPLARIKKVMKTDEEVRMISAEAPILFAKGCDIFITELTMRAWIHAEENKRRTLQRSDIAAALQKSDMFDFLIDIVPREEVVNGGGGIGNSGSNNNGGGTSSSKKTSSRQNSTGYSQSDLQQQLLQQQLLQQQFLKQQNDERNDENYQYNDMNVYENRF